MFNKILFLFVIYCCIPNGICETINFSPCSDLEDPKDFCVINEVRVNPCKEAILKKTCVLKREQPGAIELDFHALKAAETVKGLAYAVVLAELPMPGMSDEGCKFTPCPIAQGSNQTYAFDLILQKSFPRGKFNVNFKIWTENNEGCCASFYVKLT